MTAAAFCALSASQAAHRESVTFLRLVFMSRFQVRVTFFGVLLLGTILGWAFGWIKSVSAGEA
jgi:hypothetical protein